MTEAITPAATAPVVTTASPSPQHGFWWKVGHIFVAIAKKSAQLFGDDPEVAAQDAAQLAKLMWTQLQSAPGQIAQQVVEKYAAPTFADLTNAQKREGAIADVISIASEKAISLGETDVVLLVQYAYSFFSGKLKATSVDPTPAPTDEPEPVEETKTVESEEAVA